MTFAIRAGALLAVLVLPLAAQVINDPAQAGPDYQVQGEYRGTLPGNKALGCQILAQGKGTFRAWFLTGGLPGDGWDASTPVGIDGTLTGETATFGRDGAWTAQWTAGRLSGKTDKGVAFGLAKVTRVSPTLGAKPPEGAVVLFDGTDTKAFSTARMDDQKRLLALSGPTTRDAWQNFRLHVEFWLPFNPTGRGQGRVNSGVYLQRRYELQVCDSFGNLTAKPRSGDTCGELYRSVPAAVNACLPPLCWQTYDIDFAAPRFDAAGTKTAPARLTVRLNGILIHDNIEVPGKTGSGQVEGPQPLPLYLQNHGSPVFFRNVWLVPAPPAEAPAK
ncbi:MAG: DUF1080 domain-containing protein [Armatimonadetes bacterium]|nr:DUF1080 domain-containing protein [Armatimonadota bacterium]